MRKRVRKRVRKPAIDAVPVHDQRLANKAEVLVLRFAGAADSDAPVGETVAISAELLSAQPVFHVDSAAQPVVVITDASGANRVYATGERRFEAVSGDGLVRDTDGGTWTVTEEALTATGDTGVRLPRVPAHRAFWFGWVAQHPDTRLIR